jgi:dihydrofolate synthase / folylpolyglutamate synthase
MNYSESVAYLYSLGHEVLTAKYRLENIKILLQEIGNPQHNFRSILVAGTNGKGSVASMIDAIARRGGHCTALYTSPHLVRVEERLRVNGESISTEEFAKSASLIRQASQRLVEQGNLLAVPTFFEQITAIALDAFSRAKIELAVLEVGLGGRLDATNAVERIASVLTTIDYDHQEVLGNSIEAIAAEKAAIITGGAAAVIGRQLYPEALEVLRRRCAEVKVEPVLAGKVAELRLSGMGRPSFKYQAQSGKGYQVELGLRGRHQADNAALAIEAGEALSNQGFNLNQEMIISGLKEVRWPGRLELIDGRPMMLLDGAHNLAGARVLREFIIENWRGHLTLLFAAMNDKDIEGMSGELFPLADDIILTRVDEKRGATEARLRSCLAESPQGAKFFPTVEEGFEKAQAVTPENGLICVAGSLYLVGSIKRLLER